MQFQLNVVQLIIKNNTEVSNTMKFSNKKPVVTKNKFDADMLMLRKEFERIMLFQAVLESYTSPCELTRNRIYKSN